MVNSGLIRVASGANITVDVGTNEFIGTFSSSGVISIGKDARFTLGAFAALSTLGSVTNFGTFDLGGSLDCGGAALTLGQGGLFGGQAFVLGLGGFLQNGTFDITKAKNLVFAGGGFANATVTGGFRLTAAGATLALGGGVTVTGAGGVGPGVIQVTGAGATLNFYDPPGARTNAIDNVAIQLGNATTAANLDLFSYSSSSQTLTLGPQASLTSSGAGALAAIGAQFGFADTVVNQGAISAAGAGGNFTIADALVNVGSVAVSNGDTLALQGNLSGAGATSIATGGVLDIAGAAAAAQTIAFKDATGVLQLDRTASFAATIAGFTAGDVIDLTGFSANGVSVNSKDQLVVTNNGVTVATLQLKGDYGHAAFQLGSDGHGGIDITVSGAAAFVQAAAAVGRAAAAAMVVSSWERAAAAVGGLARPA